MKILAFDLETTGLNPHTDRIALAQFKLNNDPAELIATPSLAAIHDRLNKADIIIGHNLSFDFGFAKYMPKSVDHWDDTLLLSRIQDFQQETHSLDDVLRRVLKYDPYEGFDKKQMQKSNWAAPQLTREQIDYAITDVEHLHALYRYFAPTVKNSVYRFDKKSTMDGLAIQRHGLPVLRADVLKELAIQQAILAETLAELPINPLSPKQVSQYLRLPSTGDRELAARIAKGDDRAALVRAARKAKKYINFLEKLAANPRFYGTLAPHARSGRFTSKNENLQNLPRDTKRFIGSVQNVVISADFAQLELRTIACIAPDPVLIKLFKNGEDLHDYTAIQLYGEGFTKQQRQIAKVFSFALLYGAGANTVRQVLLQQTGIDMPEDEVQRRKKAWLTTYYGIAQWQKAGGLRHHRNAPHASPHGRQYVSSRYTDHLSIENQAAGAEVARIALHLINKNLPKGALLVDFVHDSYFIECAKDPAVYMKACQVIYDAMKYAWDRAPFEKYDVPMPVQVGVAHNIKDADALENCLYVYGDDV